MTPGAEGLDYHATPPIGVPFRFFISASAFGILAGGLLLMQGGALFQSRWLPHTLAWVHLITVGFMLSAMLGALTQVLPVIAGATLPSSLTFARVMQTGLSVGAAGLAWGFSQMSPTVLRGSAYLLLVTVFVFIGLALRALFRQPARHGTTRDLRFALLSLLLTVCLGVGGAELILGLFAGNLQNWVALHVTWSWAGWGLMLLAALSWQVVPMFQITPAYPKIICRFWVPVAFVGLFVISAAYLLGLHYWAAFLSVWWMLFPVSTTWLQFKSRRPKADKTFRAFQCAMLSFFAAWVLWLGEHWFDFDKTPLLIGILVLYGGFVGVIEGMLYKIVPFLVWLHGMNAGKKAPNMKKIWPDVDITMHFYVHMLSLLCLLFSVGQSEIWAHLAGVCVCIEFTLLMHSVLSAQAQYRNMMIAGEPFPSRPKSHLP